MSLAHRVWNTVWSRPAKFQDAVLATLLAYGLLCVATGTLDEFLNGAQFALGFESPPLALKPSITGIFFLDLTLELRPMLGVFWIIYSRNVALAPAFIGIVAALCMLWPNLPDSLFGTQITGLTVRLFIPLMFLVWIANRIEYAFEDWKRRRAQQ
jgi:hypothetical protein